MRLRKAIIELFMHEQVSGNPPSKPGIRADFGRLKLVRFVFVLVVLVLWRTLRLSLRKKFGV